MASENALFERSKHVYPKASVQFKVRSRCQEWMGKGESPTCPMCREVIDVHAMQDEGGDFPEEDRLYKARCVQNLFLPAMVSTLSPCTSFGGPPLGGGGYSLSPQGEGVAPNCLFCDKHSWLAGRVGTEWQSLEMTIGVKAPSPFPLQVAVLHGALPCPICNVPAPGAWLECFFVFLCLVWCFSLKGQE